MKYKVGILDSEYSYSKSLMEYINYNYSNYMCMVTFGNNVSLQEYLSLEDMDLLLVNEQEAENIDVKLPILYIVGDRERCVNGCIFKYQSAFDTANTLLHVLKQNRQISYEKKRFVGVFSPLGRCGKTELSLGLCRHSKNCLYIGMENHTGIERYIKAGVSVEELKDISKRFMYYLATENTEIISLLEKLPLLDDLKIISITGGAKDIGLISRENMLWLREFLVGGNIFSRVVVDIGVDVLSDNDILLCFDNTYILRLADKSSMGKLSFFEYENAELLEELGDKLRYIYAPDTEYDTEQMQSFIRENGL